MNHAHLAAALFMGLLATIWAASTWLPLAMGEQVCQYSEPRQYVAIFEFACILLGMVFIAVEFYRTVKGRAR